MARLGLAFKVFWRTLRDRAVADEVERLLKAGGAPALPEPKEPPKPSVEKPKKEKPPARSDAVSLLAVLQREGRLIDFLQEPLGGFSDAQIGAAARDVHRDCAKAVERLFGLKPLVGDREGAAIEVPAGFDAARYRLSGNVSGQPPFRGSLVHHGWIAARCDVPVWTGGDESALVVAPAEVEIK